MHHDPVNKGPNDEGAAGFVLKPPVDVSDFKLTEMLQQGETQPVIKKPTGIKGFWERNISHNYTHRVDVLKELLFNPHLRSYFKEHYRGDFDETRVSEIEKDLKGKDKKKRLEAENKINSLYNEFAQGRTGTALKQINKVYQRTLSHIDDWITEPIAKGNSMANGKVNFSFTPDGKVNLEIFDSAGNGPRSRTLSDEEGRAAREIFYGEGPAKFTLKISDLKNFFESKVTLQQIKIRTSQENSAADELNSAATTAAAQLKDLLAGKIQPIVKPAPLERPKVKTNAEIVKEWNSVEINLPEALAQTFNKNKASLGEIDFGMLSNKAIQEIKRGIAQKLGIKEVAKTSKEVLDRYAEALKYINIRQGKAVQEKVKQDAMQLQREISKDPDIFTDAKLLDSYESLTILMRRYSPLDIDRATALDALKQIRSKALNTPMTPESRDEQMKIIGDVRYEDISSFDPRAKEYVIKEPFNQFFKLVDYNRDIKIDFKDPEHPTIEMVGTVWGTKSPFTPETVKILKNLFEGHLKPGQTHFTLDYKALDTFFAGKSSWSDVINAGKGKSTSSASSVTLPRQPVIRERGDNPVKPADNTAPSKEQPQEIVKPQPQPQKEIVIPPQLKQAYENMGENIDIVEGLLKEAGEDTTKLFAQKDTKGFLGGITKSEKFNDYKLLKAVHELQEVIINRSSDSTEGDDIKEAKKTVRRIIDKALKTPMTAETQFVQQRIISMITRENFSTVENGQKKYEFPLSTIKELVEKRNNPVIESKRIYSTTGENIANHQIKFTFNKDGSFTIQEGFPTRKGGKNIEITGGSKIIDPEQAMIFRNLFRNFMPGKSDSIVLDSDLLSRIFTRGQTWGTVMDYSWWDVTHNANFSTVLGKSFKYKGIFG